MLFQFTMIIYLFTFCLKREDYKILIHNNNRFINFPFDRENIYFFNSQYIIDLIASHLKAGYNFIIEV